MRTVVKVWRVWKRFVYVTCPGCGVEASLDHTVEANGDVNPSLDCPECDFHVMATLENWTHGKIESR